MPSAPPLIYERQRLATLHESGRIEASDDQSFNDLTGLASSLLDAPIAVITLVDAEGSWIKSGVGARVMDRDASFCALTILGDSPLIVPDTAADPRTRQNIFVTGEPHVRFYAATSIRTPQGQALGALAILGLQPRTLSDAQINILQMLARQAASLVELNRTRRLLAEQAALSGRERALFQAAVDGIDDAIHIQDVRGRYLVANAAAARFCGGAPSEMIGCDDSAFFDADLAKKTAETDQEVFRSGLACERQSEMKIGGLTEQFTYPDGEEVTHRAIAEGALRKSERFSRAILDSMPNHVCVLDPAGNITATNHAWERFASTGAPQRWGNVAVGCGVGSNYLQVCEAASPRCPDARRSFEGIRSVLDGALEHFHMEYLCPTPVEDRWFEMTVTPLSREPRADNGERGAVVVHTDITDNKRSELTLRASETRYRLALDAARMGTWRHDLLTDQISADDRCRTLWGWTAATGTLPTLLQTVHPEDRPRIALSIAEAHKAVEGDGTHSVEYRALLPDGNARWLFCNAQVLFDQTADGRRKASTVIGTVVDITASKQAAELVRLNAVRMAAAQRVAGLGVWEWDCVESVWWSDELYSMYGRAPGAFTPTLAGFMSHVPEADREYVDAMIKGALGSDVAYRFEHRIIRADGVVRLLDTDGLVERDAAGKPIRMWGVCRDVTEVRPAEEALRASERRFRELADAIPQIVWSAAADGTLDHLNARAIEYSGVKPDDLTSWSWEALLHPDDVAGTVANWAEALRSGTPRDMEFRLRRADGEYRWHIGRQVTSHGPDGRIARWYGTCTDVDDQKRVEAALRASDERYRTLFDHIPTPMFVYDRETLRYIAVNDAAVAEYGYSRQEFRSMTIMDIRPKGDAVALREALSRSSGAYEHRGVWRHRKKSGSVIHVEVTAHDLDLDGRPSCICLAVDVTDRQRAEAQVRESNERFHLVARATSDAVWDLDIAAGVVWRSDKTTGLFGYPASDVGPDLGWWASRVHPRDHDRILASVTAAYRGSDEFWSGEYRFRRADGSYVNILDRAYVIRAPDGRATRMVGAMMDITDRKHAEHLLMRQNRALERIAKGDALSVTLNEIVDLVEERLPGSLCSILLLDPKANRLRSAAGRSIPDAYHTAIDGVCVGPQCGSCGTAVFRGKPVIVSDIATDPLWDDYRDVALANGLRSCWSVPIFAGDQRTLGTFAVYRTAPASPGTEFEGVMATAAYLAGVAIEREQSLRALRESEARLRLALQAAEMGIWEFHPETGGIHCSEGVHQIVGVPAGDIENGGVDAFRQLIHPEDSQKLWATVQAAFENGSRFDMEFRVIPPDGRVRWMANHASVFADPDRSTATLIGTVADITSRKEIEALTNQHRAEIAHLSRVASVGEMASSLAHELNQPLTAILGYAGVCLDAARADAGNSAVSRESAVHLAEACSEAKRASEIVTRLRGFIRKQVPKQEAMDVNRLARAAIDLLRFEFREAAITPQLCLHEEISPVSVDAVQIQQVLINLLQNALDALRGTTPAERRLSVTTSRYNDSPGGMVRVSVRDNGPGVAPDMLDRVFESFFTTKETGLGLGLSICRSIVESHGGRLTATCNLDRGMTFHFTLPIVGPRR